MPAGPRARATRREACLRPTPGQRTAEGRRDLHRGRLRFLRGASKYVETGVRGDRHVPFLCVRRNGDLPERQGTACCCVPVVPRIYIDGKTMLKTHFPPNDSATVITSSPIKRLPRPRSRLPLRAAGQSRVVVRVRRHRANRSSSCSKRWSAVTGKAFVALNRRNHRRMVQRRHTDPGNARLRRQTRACLTTTTDGPRMKTNARALRRVMNDKRRAELRAKSDPYWKTRREGCKAMAGKADAVKLPELPVGRCRSLNDIDNFIGATIAKVKCRTTLASGQHGLLQAGAAHPRNEVPRMPSRRQSQRRSATRHPRRRHERRRNDGSAITPGKPDHSAILKRVVITDEDEVMPPKGAKLTPAEVAAHDLDRGRCRVAGIRADRTEVTALTDDLTFLRRVTGCRRRVPSLEEIAAFQRILIASGDRQTAR